MTKDDLKSLWKFIVFAAVILLADFIIENINGRFWLNDFKVYYLAAKALLSGGQVYGIPFGLSSGLYKYSPFVLFFVFPYCLFSFKIASIIHFFVLSIIIIGVFFVIRSIFKNHFFGNIPANMNLIFSFALICVAIHFVKELHLGNINVVLLLLLSLSLYSMLRSQQVPAGVLFGLVVLTKPFFLILILPLLFRKKWIVLVSLTGTLILGFLIPAIFFGFPKSAFLHIEWVRNIFAHQSDYPGHNSMQYLVQRYISPDVPNEFQYVIIALGALLFLILHYFSRNFEKRSGDTEKIRETGLIVEWFFLTALLPNLVKTDSEHFLCSLPLIIISLFYLVTQKKILPSAIFFILVFFYSVTCSTDILGTELSNTLFNMGLIGISNLFIIGFALLVIYRSDVIRSNILQDQ